MTDTSALRDAIETRLATISGLNTYDTVPDNPVIPFATVLPTGIEYDAGMSDGAHTWRFGILVAVHRASESTAQDALDAYCDPTGTRSIRAAINGDRTLGGLGSCRVLEMRNYSQIPIGEVTYLGAEFVVEVVAT
jgi:hypothetical protein